MNRRNAWWTAILSGWGVTSLLLGLLIAVTASTHAAALVIEQAVVVAAVPCLIVGGPAAGVALRYADSQGVRRARLRGWAVGLAVLVALVAGAFAAGVGIADSLVLIGLAVAAAEVMFALRLYRQGGLYSRSGAQPPTG